jgi:hypothetical protein
MFEKPLMFELIMMLVIMFALVMIYLFFRRGRKGKRSSNAPVVEKFQELLDILDKKTLMQMGKLDLTSISSKREPLVRALKELKESSEGFTTSMENIITIIDGDAKVSKKKTKKPIEPEIEDDDEEEDDPVEDTDEGEDDESQEAEDEEEEPEEVEGFVDAHAHGYMSL